MRVALNSSRLITLIAQPTWLNRPSFTSKWRRLLVSSLPSRSLPKDVGAETVDSICRFLAHSVDRKLVQFTYQPRAPFAAPRGLRWHRRAVVWRNTPPAGIWELQAAR